MGMRQTLFVTMMDVGNAEVKRGYENKNAKWRMLTADAVRGRFSEGRVKMKGKN